MGPKDVGRRMLAAAGCAVAILASGTDPAKAQQPAQGRDGGRGGGGMSSALFTALDASNDGALTRDELKATFDGWYAKWDASIASYQLPVTLVTGYHSERTD
jgi:hypothetical protein